MTKPVPIKNLILGEGMPKICVPLTGTTEDALVEETKAAVAAGADLVEWRADFYEGLECPKKTEGVLSALSGILGQTPLLFTIRTREEGGSRQISLEDYAKSNLLAARSHKADLIDVEAFGHREKKAELIAALQAEGAKVIASSHDFQKTDGQAALLARFEKMDKTGADILKMAVMPLGFGDVAALMEATWRMQGITQKPLVSMAMGSIGAITRIAGESFGSCITFGTVGAASAPGQLPIKELRMMLETLGRV